MRFLITRVRVNNIMGFELGVKSYNMGSKPVPN